MWRTQQQMLQTFWTSSTTGALESTGHRTLLHKEMSTVHLKASSNHGREDGSEWQTPKQHCFDSVSAAYIFVFQSCWCRIKSRLVFTCISSSSPLKSHKSLNTASATHRLLPRLMLRLLLIAMSPHALSGWTTAADTGRVHGPLLTMNPRNILHKV